jgi:hypothetical protein
MKEEKTIIHTYRFSLKELKQKFGLKGTFISFLLYAGRSQNDMSEGKSDDVDVYEIKTEEVVG